MELLQTKGYENLVEFLPRIISSKKSRFSQPFCGGTRLTFIETADSFLAFPARLASEQPRGGRCHCMQSVQPRVTAVNTATTAGNAFLTTKLLFQAVAYAVNRRDGYILGSKSIT